MEISLYLVNKILVKKKCHLINEKNLKIFLRQLEHCKGQQLVAGLKDQKFVAHLLPTNYTMLPQEQWL